MKNLIIGIDISAETLDICLKTDSGDHFEVIANEISAIRKLFRGFKTFTSVVVAMENTGRYNWNLFEVLEKFNFQVYVINPLHLKKSMGLSRGKNDKIDSERIAHFIDRNQQDVQAWQPSSESMKKLKVLLTERKSKVKLKSSLLQQKKNYKCTKAIGLEKMLLKINEKEIKLLNDHIKFLEQEMEKVIKLDEELRLKSELMQSVPGVGKVLTWNILAKTDNFQMINTARKLACYSGVIPFDHQSGTSLRYRPKVSPFADKSLKSILHLGAMSVVKLDNDLSKYYKRKVLEGKNKMLVLNNIRNKIIHLIFAVLKSGIKYENNHQNRLAVS